MPTTTTTIVQTSDSNNQSQQVYHVQVEYEDPKPKAKPDTLQNTRKRTRMGLKDAIEISSQQVVTSPKPQVVYLDEKVQYQDVVNLNNDTEPLLKVSRREESMDQFDVFGRLVANELRQLNNPTLQSKFKKKILKIILDMNDDDEGGK